ncbi:MAG: hypothetical protein PF488_01175 [Patescibacteria group bacterium]|jgi:hypothetical protein|nr:hypothetical protein [Patescibacteria group bacterium]
MSNNELEYFGSELIKKDLKRLKKWSSLEKDIKNILKIINGQLTDEIYRCPQKAIFEDFITEKNIEGEIVGFFKKRIPITSCKIGPSAGARLLFGVIKSSNKFIPILLYGAFEEKSFYKINNKKIKLQSSGLIQIIQEKLNSL